MATVAFDPDAPGWGSWDWVGADLLRALNGRFLSRRVTRRTAMLYAPVDFYDSADAIDADASWLRRCARVLVHCERLRRYFEPYAPVEYIDHHVKFTAPMRERFQPEANLLPLVDWVNAHPLPAPLDVLTNPEDPARPPTPAEVGFRPGIPVTIHDWTPRRHIEMTAAARAVLDIKGDDFRSRHKPPAKGIDFIASGVPLAMNPDSSTTEHLARMGFDLADPLDTEWWLSPEYGEETRRFGLALRELLSLERVARRLKRVIDEVLAERRGLEVP